MKLDIPARLRWCALALVALGAAGCPTVETEQPVIEGTTVRLTVLRTSDIHSRLFPTYVTPNTHDQNQGLFVESAPYGGLERVAGLIHRERQRGQRVLYMDSGDVFQGAPIFNYSEGEPEFRWMSLLGVDAMALGNHEFDKGPEVLSSQAERWVNFPFLAANYIFADWTDVINNQLGRRIYPFTIVNAKGLKVGVIGLGDISSMYSITEGGNSSGIIPLEANETVRSYIDFLSPAVDLVVVLSHLGLSEDQELTDGHEIFVSWKQDVSAYLKRTVDPWKPMRCPECEQGVRKYWVPGVRGIDAILGGHLHILTAPPMLLTDPAGRKVVLEHPGAFAKYMTRLDFMVAVPNHAYTCDTGRSVCVPEDNHFSQSVACATDADCAVSKLAPYGAEIVAHAQKVFPIDEVWCAEPRLDPNSYEFGDTTGFPNDIATLASYCSERGDGNTRNLLEPYRVRMELDPKFVLSEIFGYSPKGVPRKDLGTGGDSPLGNMVTLAMMIRKRVEAEFCITNTLGIRDNFYPGLVDMETVFNVFPFENTVTIMYLSGREIQEMLDFNTERSNDRGCQSQAQISGGRYVMNCGQVVRNQTHTPCETAEDCCPLRPEICEANYKGSARWECQLGICYSHPAENIVISGWPLILDASYKIATNDYLAGGGSGFKVLKRNTTKINTGIPMRDVLIEYMRGFPTCEELIATTDPNLVDPFSLSFCLEHQAPEDQRAIPIKGICTCGDILDFYAFPDDEGLRQEILKRCKSIGPLVVQFCENPLAFPIIVGKSDGRITTKVN